MTTPNIKVSTGPDIDRIAPLAQVRWLRAVCMVCHWNCRGKIVGSRYTGHVSTSGYTYTLKVLGPDLLGTAEVADIPACKAALLSIAANYHDVCEKNQIGGYK